MNGRGGQLGPDLSRIGSGRPRGGTRNGKLRGSADFMRPGYEPVTIVTREGERIRGIKKNEDEFSIQIMDTRERLQGYLKANLSEVTVEKQSLMPVYGPDRLNDRDLDDLLRISDRPPRRGATERRRDRSGTCAACQADYAIMQVTVWRATQAWWMDMRVAIIRITQPRSSSGCLAPLQLRHGAGVRCRSRRRICAKGWRIRRAG